MNQCYALKLVNYAKLTRNTRICLRQQNTNPTTLCVHRQVVRDDQQGPAGDLAALDGGDGGEAAAAAVMAAMAEMAASL